MQKLHAQNVLHAEVYVSVGVMHWRGGEFAPLFEGLETRTPARRARLRHVPLLDLRRSPPFRRGGPDACSMKPFAAKTSESVIGIGLGGDERRAAPELFRDVYARAASEGLRTTVHAGETVGPESSLVGAARAEGRSHRPRPARHRRSGSWSRYLAEHKCPWRSASPAMC